MDIIDRINGLLAAKGTTGAEMSRDLGLSNSAYSQWNTRKTKPSKKSIQVIAAYLGTTADYLMFGTEPEKAKAPTQQGESGDILDEVDVAFYGAYKELTEDDKETVRDMVRLMRERRKGK